MNKLLLLSAFISTTTELLPQFNMSYFLPRSLNKKVYDDRLFMRIIVVFLVWAPISIALYKISPQVTRLAILLIMIAFYKRRLSKYHNRSIASKFYTIGLLLVGYILDSYIPILIILLGGSVIGNYRNGNYNGDILGRIIFTYGYYNFIFDLITKFGK